MNALPNLDSLIRNALSAPPNATGYLLNEALVRAFPEGFVFRTADPSFDVSTFVERAGVSVTVHPEPAPLYVLVFANGCWSRSTTLKQAIEGSTFENLVLQPGLADELRTELEWFLKSRAEYVRYGAPWKRGVLLVGPPGNGKTHCIKAILNHLELPCLYVQSFEAPYTNPQSNVAQVFERARRTTPCALVLEDLDSLVSDRTRSDHDRLS